MTRLLDKHQPALGRLGVGAAWTSVRITLEQRVLSAYCEVAPGHTATPWAAERQASSVQPLCSQTPGARPVPPAWRQFLPQDSQWCLLIRACPASAQVPGCFSSHREFEITARSGPGRRLHTSGAARKQMAAAISTRPPPTSSKTRPGRPSGRGEQGSLAARPGSRPADAPSGCPSP